MYRAVVVYQSTPMFGRNKLPDGNILGMFKQNKLVKELNRELQKELRHGQLSLMTPSQISTKFLKMQRLFSVSLAYKNNLIVEIILKNVFFILTLWTITM